MKNFQKYCESIAVTRNATDKNMEQSIVVKRSINLVLCRYHKNYNTWKTKPTPMCRSKYSGTGTSATLVHFFEASSS